MLRYKHRKLVIDTDSFRGREYYRLEIDGEDTTGRTMRMTSFLVANTSRLTSWMGNQCWKEIENS